VLLSGGAWSRAFGLNHGLDLPQLKAVSSVMRAGPMEGGPSVIAAIGSYGVSPRLDGGYTISSSTTIADIVPDSFRQFWLFLPQFLAERRSIRLRLGRRFVDEWRMPRRWGDGQISPFEMERILSPSPIARHLDMPMQDLAIDFPAFRNAVVAERWAGFIEATPDMLPIICPIDDIPGLVVSTGYSGHGFGLGPAAGRLSADMVTGRTPLVDPTPFRLDRFDPNRAFLSKVN
jgi:glycine/D-amino acid oxidase-like deaminating enzyme